MIIENKDGGIGSTVVYDDYGQEIGLISELNISHNAGEPPIATMKVLKPVIRTVINGRFVWDLDKYSRQQKESLYKRLEVDLRDK